MLVDLPAATALTNPPVRTIAAVHSNREPCLTALCHSTVPTRPALSLNARLRLAVVFHYLSSPAIRFQDNSLLRIA